MFRCIGSDRTFPTSRLSPPEIARGGVLFDQSYHVVFFSNFPGKFSWFLLRPQLSSANVQWRGGGGCITCPWRPLTSVTPLGANARQRWRPTTRGSNFSPDNRSRRLAPKFQRFSGFQNVVGGQKVIQHKCQAQTTETVERDNLVRMQLCAL